MLKRPLIFQELPKILFLLLHQLEEEVTGLLALKTSMAHGSKLTQLMLMLIKPQILGLLEEQAMTLPLELPRLTLMMLPKNWLRTT